MKTTPASVKVAVCDPEAFYPLRNLVAGPFNTLDNLAAIERFIRTVVLHDEMVMQLTPQAYDPETDFEFTEEERRAGGRLVITAMGPVLTGFDFFTEGAGRKPIPEIELSPDLIKAASQHANAGAVGAGNVYFKTHVDYLKRVLGIVIQGGSALLCSDLGQQVITTAEKYPAALFERLDEEWRRLAQSAQQTGLGLLVPPLLGIVLTRCARRDAIPIVIRDLRDEWAVTRRKIWALLEASRASRTSGEFMTIERELSQASRLFSPQETKLDSHPIRVF